MRAAFAQRTTGPGMSCGRRAAIRVLAAPRSSLAIPNNKSTMASLTRGLDASIARDVRRDQLVHLVGRPVPGGNLIDNALRGRRHQRPTPLPRY